MTDETNHIEEEKKYPRGEHPNSIANQKRYGSDNANPPSQEIAGSTKPWSYRNAARYISAQRVDTADPKAISKLVPKNPTVAELIIANTVAKASKGDMRAVEYLTEQVDGKVAQTNINAEYAQIMNMTDEQIEDELNQFYERRQHATAVPADASAGEGEGK